MAVAELNKWEPLNETVTTDSGFRYLDTKSVIKKTHTIEAIDEHHLFILFYKLNNSLRYCNGSYYTFIDPEMDKKYKAWTHSEAFEKIHFKLYYGNGVVD